MRFPDDDGLPLWLFILIILLTTVTLAVISYVVWSKCIRRPKKQDSSSPDTSEGPVRKISVKRGQIVRASWNESLTGSRFGYAASREHSRHPSSQWPETAYSVRRYDGFQKPSFNSSMRSLPIAEDRPQCVPGRSWPDFVRMRNQIGLASGRESIRASYVSFSSDHQQADTTISKPPFPNFERDWLDSPTPLPPMTPLTLPRTPNSAPCHASSQTPSNYAPVPRLPSEYCISRCGEDDFSASSTAQMHSQEENLRFSSFWSRPHGYSSSTVTRESFLQAWSNVYRSWLVYPESPSSSKPVKPTTSHVEVVSVTDSASMALDEPKRNVSLPYSTAARSTLSISPVSRPDSCGTDSVRSYRLETGRPFVEASRSRKQEISWLVES